MLRVLELEGPHLVLLAMLGFLVMLSGASARSSLVYFAGGSILVVAGVFGVSQSRNRKLALLIPIALAFRLLAPLENGDLVLEDSHTTFAITTQFLRDGRASVLPLSMFETVTRTSAWPGLEIEAATFVQASGLDLRAFFLWFGPLTGALFVVLVFLIACRIFRLQEIAWFTAVAAAALPQFIYWQMQTVSQTFAILLFVLLLYVISLRTDYSGLPPVVATLAVAMATAISHHLTAVAIAASLGLGYALRLHRGGPRPSIVFPLFFVTFLGGFWLYYAGDIVTASVTADLRKFLLLQESTPVISSSYATAEGSLLASSAPMLALEVLRTGTLLALGFIGLLRAIRSRVSMSPGMSLLSAVALVSGMMVLYGTIVTQAAYPERFGVYAMMSAVFLSGLAILSLQKGLRQKWIVAVLVAIVLMIAPLKVFTFVGDQEPAYLWQQETSVSAGQYGRVVVKDEYFSTGISFVLNHSPEWTVYADWSSAHVLIDYPLLISRTRTFPGNYSCFSGIPSGDSIVALDYRYLLFQATRAPERFNLSAIDDCLSRLNLVYSNDHYRIYS